MRLSFHGCSSMHTNLVTDIRIVKEVGYDAIEITTAKLGRYLDAGYHVEALLPVLGGLFPASISSIDGIECQKPDERRSLLRRCERFSEAARALGCPAIQVIALDGLKADPWGETRVKIARSLGELADIAVQVGVSLTLEPVVVSPLRTLAQALEVLEMAGKENVGLGIDLFHLWAGGTSWDEIARLDPKLMASVHVGDGTIPKGREWTDDDRGVLPGDGVVPLREGIAAVRSAGYDDLWTVECYSPYHWEWDPEVYYRELKRRMVELLADQST